MYNLKKDKISHIARRPIKDRGIIWKETYTDKSLATKKQMEKELGPGSYYRWEGHDPTTGNDYYVVLGPSESKKLGKSFFAGIRKLPANYAANGEYFATMRQAARYANDLWAVSIPRGMGNYSSKDLVNVDLGKEKSK